MHQSVRSAFVPFTERFEGRTDWFYLDLDGAVTIGYGNKVDPVADALGLDFISIADGSAVAWSDVVSAWMVVKNHQQLRKRGGGEKGPFPALTRIRATKASIDHLVDSKLLQHEFILERVFPEWMTWPADAQLAVLSMAWAMGPYFTVSWPHFTATAKAQDWTACAVNCHMRDTDNPGLRPRNTANVRLFQAAADVVATGKPIDCLTGA